MIQGETSEKKSTFVLNLVAMLITGIQLLFSVGEYEPMNVIYQNTEDDPEDMIVPRFMNADGDLNRIFLLMKVMQH